MKTKLLFGALALGSVLALSGSAALAAPPPPPFGFQFGITVGPDHAPPPPPHIHDDSNDDDECISLKAIFADLQDQGYSRFKGYNDDDDDYFTVNARRGSRLYRLVVDSCTGDILNRKRLNF